MGHKLCSKPEETEKNLFGVVPALKTTTSIKLTGLVAMETLKHLTGLGALLPFLLSDPERQI